MTRHSFQNQYSNPSVLPTPLFFYGPQIDQEYSLHIDKGKSLIIRYLAKSETNKNGKCSVFFELNGQPRTIEINDNTFNSEKEQRPKADNNNVNHVASPLPGQVTHIFVKENDKIIKGDKLLVIEAMKMETTINAEKSGNIKKILVEIGNDVESKDLLLEIS